MTRHDLIRAGDLTRGPLTRYAASAAIRRYGTGSHIVILRHARNLCWHEWHTNPYPYERYRAQLGWALLDNALEKT